MHEKGARNSGNPPVTEPRWLTVLRSASVPEGYRIVAVYDSWLVLEIR